MPASRTGAPLDQVREVLRARVAATSLRRVAREVGMSPTGLQKVLAGGSPYSATQRKLDRWYVREAAQYGGSLSAGSALTALQVLLQDLPPARHEAALSQLAAELRAIYDSAAVPRPQWLQTLERSGPVRGSAS